jgi:membrane-bound lytic murein transglycosylase A
MMPRLVGVRGARWALALMAATALAGCGRVIPEGRGPALPPPPVSVPVQSVPVAPPPPANALVAGVRAGPSITSMGLTPATAGPVLSAFRLSCPKLLSRNDTSGLTQKGDWQNACSAANDWPTEDAANFFNTYFGTATIGSGATFVTGYYEPEIAGSRQHVTGYDVPVYGMPADLVHARPGDAPVKPNGQTPFGRYDETGHFVPYYERAQIEDGQLNGQGLEIGWAADPVEFFFLQVQGSGRLRGPDGRVMRIGYAGDNGQNYTNIGGLMRQQGLIGTGPGQYPGSMQGIIAYIRDHPDEGRALMRQNKSWVFFRELTGEGPIGAMGVAVRPHVSVAADPLFVPLGAPVFLSMDPALAGATQANGLWIAQDTGGAIKGANRFDSFWGAGDDARRIAGGLSGRGTATLLLPRGALARLGIR